MKGFWWSLISILASIYILITISSLINEKNQLPTDPIAQRIYQINQNKDISPALRAILIEQALMTTNHVSIIKNNP